VKSSNCKLTALAYHRRILFTDFFSQSLFPSAIAIMMVPMMIVHTICEELKYGASSLLAPSSTAITDIPEKNSVRYKNNLFFKMPRFFLSMSTPFLFYLFAAIMPAKE